MSNLERNITAGTNIRINIDNIKEKNSWRSPFPYNEAKMKWLNMLVL